MEKYFRRNQLVLLVISLDVKKNDETCKIYENNAKLLF